MAKVVLLVFEREQFFLTVGQNNFGNKIPFLATFVTSNINVDIFFYLGLLILSFMGVDNPIAMVLLIVFCLFGIATTTKGTSFTKESLSNF